MYCYHKDKRAKQVHLLAVWLSPLLPPSLPFRNVCLFHFCNYFPCHPLLYYLLRLSIELQTAGIIYWLQLLVNCIAPNPMDGVVTFLIIFLLHVFNAYLPSSWGSYFNHVLHHVSGIEFRWGRDFPPVQIGPVVHPASCKMGTGSFPGVKCGRGVLLTTHPLLVPRSWKSRAIPLPTLWSTPGL